MKKSSGLIFTIFPKNHWLTILCLSLLIIVGLIFHIDYLYNKIAAKPPVEYVNDRLAEHHVSVLLENVRDIFNIRPHGVIHIGAHYAEELPIYKKLNVQDILWIEADPTSQATLEQATAKDPYSMVAMFAATDQNGVTKLYRTSNQGASSSILKLNKHLLMEPNTIEEDVLVVPQRRLDDYMQTTARLKDKKFNIMVLDIQGAELRALKGAIKTLRNIDVIISEVNYDELYANAVKIADLDQFLLKHGFVRVDTISCNKAFGDAVYVKQTFCRF